MKKLTFLTFALMGIFALSSCGKKDWVCECKIGGSTSKITIHEATKRQAKANCVSTTTGSSPKEECELK
mgnify:CR=1 FL=1